MKKITLIIVSLLAATSVAFTAVIVQRSLKQRRAQLASLEEQSGLIEQARAENARLSQLVAQAGTGQKLSTEQLRDLIRLRNEARQLRSVAGQNAQLEANNARLRDLAARSQAALDHARSLPNYWPKDQLAFSGFANPPSAVRSMLTAMKDGDLNAMRACSDPVIVANFEAALKRGGANQADVEAQLKSNLTDFVGKAEGFHIVDQTTNAPDQVTVFLSLDGAGEGKVLRLVMKRTGNEWKFFEGF